MFLHRFVLALSLGCCLSSVAAAAKPSTEPFPLSATSTVQFREQASHLRDELKAGRYAGLKPLQKTTINQQLDRLDALYVQRASGATFTDADAVTLVNASSAINAILLDVEDQRMVCEQIKAVGSNRSTRVCMSAAERRELQRNTNSELRDRRAFGGP